MLALAACCCCCCAIAAVLVVQACKESRTGGVDGDGKRGEAGLTERVLQNERGVGTDEATSTALCLLLW